MPNFTIQPNKEAWFWGAVAGFFAAGTALADILPWWIFIPLMMATGGALAAATFSHRPGAGV